MNISSLEVSININGPGRRLCIWLQGCNLSCQGCFNPHTHTAKDRFRLTPAQIVDHITDLDKEQGIRGVTLTGGEPLQQADEVLDLLIQLPNHLDVLLFTGYSIKEVLADPIKSAIIKLCDAALCGRYNALQNMPPLACKKLLLPSGKIRKEEIYLARSVELVLSRSHGLITGFPC
jgi:organic radical activating enzyme